MDQGIVQAAGGIIANDDGEFLVIHRPKYDDWSFPKGKLDNGEELADCALREVLEETGFLCQLGDRIGTVSYTDRKGRSKEVHYWRMDVVEGSFEPNEEVDQIVWLTVPNVTNRLSYEHDQEFFRKKIT